jgi:PEP-CTERM motif
MNAAVRLSLCGVAAAGALGFVSAPAQATLQVIADVNGSVSSCVDQAACDSNLTVGIIQVANGTLNGVQINGSIQTSTGTPANAGIDTLNTSSLSIINTTGATKTVTIAVSDTDFTGPVVSFLTAGSGVWQSAIGSSITMKWFDDPANGQGADNPTDTPGNLIDSFTHLATLFVDSFAHNGIGAISDPGPFSMTEQAVFTLTPFAQLVNRGQTEVKVAAVPEPSTWLIMLLGFVGLGYAGFRKARTRSAISIA